MAPPNSIKILKISHIPPQPSDPHEPITEFSLPLTFLDTFCFKFPPIECLFFYSLKSSDPSPVASTLSKLKHSLSLTLKNFLPLAGNLTWPTNSPKPIILYKPGNAVSLTVAESTADFHHFSSDHAREASESRSFIPNLLINDMSSSIMALQITLFPNTGLCIAATFHHAVLDGKSSAMFIKSWAYVTKHNPPLLPELTPFYDRTAIKDPKGLDTLYLDRWLAKTSSDSGRSRLRRPFDHWSESEPPSDWVRSTFHLTLGEIEKLRTWVLNQWEKRNEQANDFKTSMLRLSSFVLASAHVLTTMVKAAEGEVSRKVYFVVSADYRRRLDPPLPENYFGNCAGCHLGYAGEAREVSEEGGTAIVAAKIGDLIKRWEKKGVLEGADERLKRWGLLEPESQLIAITWSPQLGIYGSDFGWGRPEKVEIASVRRKSISLMESRDGSGAFEVGLVLKKPEMDRFGSLFGTNLKAL
ncbi:Transferase [Parasponia andersonii]|uniref:Transferase n=1 Tax=Parasponia andersonii TaxID=3476 RepID=A0A2P5BBP1_PARAD|nr:Transferase [Parasponia andersonii]